MIWAFFIPDGNKTYAAKTSLKEDLLNEVSGIGFDYIESFPLSDTGHSFVWVKTVFRKKEQYR